MLDAFIIDQIRKNEELERLPEELPLEIATEEEDHPEKMEKTKEEATIHF